MVAKTSPTPNRKVRRASAKAEVITLPVAKGSSAEFVFSGEEVTGEMVWQFINSQAGGNPNNVIVVSLDNFRVNDKKPTPFGYARPGGPRSQFHDFHGKGVPQETGKPSFKLGVMLDRMRKMDGHSKQKMICTCALLNGGYSLSSKTWGTPFIKLVVQA